MMNALITTEKGSGMFAPATNYNLLTVSPFNDDA